MCRHLLSYPVLSTTCLQTTEGALYLDAFFPLADGCPLRHKPHHVVPAGPALVVEVHGPLRDYLLSVGAGHLCREVVGGVVTRAQLVPGGDRDARVTGDRCRVGYRRAVTLHVGEGHTGCRACRVLQAEVGVEPRAAGALGEVERGGRSDAVLPDPLGIRPGVLQVVDRVAGKGVDLAARDPAACVGPGGAVILPDPVARSRVEQVVDRVVGQGDDLVARSVSFQLVFRSAEV